MPDTTVYKVICGHCHRFTHVPAETVEMIASDSFPFTLEDLEALAWDTDMVYKDADVTQLLVAHERLGEITRSLRSQKEDITDDTQKASERGGEHG